MDNGNKCFEFEIILIYYKYKQIEMIIGIIWIVYKKYEFLHLINKEQVE
jgi:hypothetical protein